MSDKIPAQIMAIAIREYGGPDVLIPTTIDCPAPAAGEVLIKVAVAGVNRPDVVQRQGNYAPPPGASPIPGLEVAGTVVKLGQGVTDFAVGDDVTALLTGGGYTEYCTAPVGQVLPIPRGFSMTEAAAIPETFFTVWSNVFGRGQLKAGETILVHGGTSGIGTTTIMLAKAFGARVIATAGSDDKCATCLALGADLAINYRNEDFASVIAKDTGGKGVDVILDMVAGDYTDRNIKSLAVDGRLIQIAFLKGPKVEINLTPIMLKRLTITGSTLRSRDIAFKTAVATELRQHVWPLFEAGKIRPIIDSEYPLEDAAEAHRRMDGGDHIGKIMLWVPED